MPSDLRKPETRACSIGDGVSSPDLWFLAWSLSLAGSARHSQYSEHFQNRQDFFFDRFPSSLLGASLPDTPSIGTGSEYVKTVFSTVYPTSEKAGLPETFGQGKPAERSPEETVKARGRR